MRPPVGIVVDQLPTYRTVVTVDGLGYYYANGAYYRERTEAGYMVAEAPGATAAGGDALPVARLFVDPRNGQSADQQARDENDCHRWAVTQSPFDPSARATGQAGASPTGREDDQRARAACLEGRGYTVR